MLRDNRFTLVFMPGMLNTKKVWSHQQKKLEKHYKIIHADVYQDDDLVRMARRIYTKITGKMILIGLSLGGYCALEIFKQQPRRIAGIALFGTRARAPTQTQAATYRRLMQQASKGRFIGVGEKKLDNILGARGRNNHLLRKTVRRMALECGRLVYLKQQTAVMRRPCYISLLKNITVPVLCVSGEHDCITPPKYLKEISARVEKALYYEIKKCGHLAPVEFPEESSALLWYWAESNFSY